MGGGKGKEKAPQGQGEKGKEWRGLLRLNSIRQPDRAHARTNGTKRNDFLVWTHPQPPICKGFEKTCSSFACLVAVCKGFKGNVQILSLCAHVLRSCGGMCGYVQRF